MIRAWLLGALSLAFSAPEHREVSYPLTFRDANGVVAALRYDSDRGVCDQTGDLAAAFRVLFANFDRVSEERNRLKWGDLQVATWKREQRPNCDASYRGAIACVETKPAACLKNKTGNYEWKPILYARCDADGHLIDTRPIGPRK